MKKVLSIILAMLFLLSMVPSMALTLSTGDLMAVEGASSVPMYASYNPRDYTVITYVPAGKTVLYIAAVDRGYCVAYENFVGYISEDYLRKVSSYAYDFQLPSGDAFRNVSGAARPGFTAPPASSYPGNLRSFPYSAVRIYPNQNISTRTGPGTNYTEPGTFSRNLNYVVYYQTKGGSVYWGYVEFMQNNKKMRAYTGVKRFSSNGYVPSVEEDYCLMTISSSVQTYYGPGYDYAPAPFDQPRSGETVKAFFTENGWTMIEYTLSNGYLHRGWVPNAYLN